MPREAIETVDYLHIFENALKKVLPLQVYPLHSSHQKECCFQISWKPQLVKWNTAIRSFEKIAYCKRKDQTIRRLDKLQPIDKDLYEYLMKIGPESYRDSLMVRFRPENLTSNSVESLWAHTMDCRSETRLPLLFKAMNNFAIYKLYKIEKEMELCVEDFTPYACEHIKERTDWGVKKGIRVTQFSSTRLTGTTSDTKGRLSSIDLNTMACTCQAKIGR